MAEAEPAEEENRGRPHGRRGGCKQGGTENAEYLDGERGPAGGRRDGGGGPDGRLLADRLGIRLARGGDDPDPAAGRGARHRPAVLRRAAAAGEPDRRDPVLRRPGRRRDPARAGRGDRLGQRARGGQGGGDSGGPARPAGGQFRRPLPDRRRLGSRPRGRGRRPMARGCRRRRGVPRRRAAGHDRLLAGHRPRDRLPQRHRGPRQYRDRPQPDRRLHPHGRQGGDGELPAGRVGAIICALYAHNDDMALGAIQAIKEAGDRTRARTS